MFTPQDNSGTILPGNIYACRDIYLAAALVTFKFPLKSIEIQVEAYRARPVGYFLFENSELLNETIAKFRSESLIVEPNAYIRSWKSLKSEVTSLERSPTSPQTITPTLNPNFPKST